MTEKAKTVGASADELMKAFETSEEKIAKRMGIKDKLTMPVPNGKPVTVRLLWSKDDGGQPISVMKKENPKFRDGTAYFMTVELYDTPGEKQVSLSKSLFGSLMAAAKERDLTLDEIIGKIGDITAQYYTGAPKSQRRGVCPECHGKGCKACTVTGSGQDAGIATGLATPVVYNFRLRDDLMQPVKGGAASQF